MNVDYKEKFESLEKEYEHLKKSFNYLRSCVLEMRRQAKKRDQMIPRRIFEAKRIEIITNTWIEVLNARNKKRKS